MKALITILSALSFLLLTGQANADDGNDGQTVTLQMATPEQAAQLAKCLKLAQAETPKAKKPRRKRVRKARKPWCPPCVRVVKAEIRRINVRIGGLQNRISLNATGLDQVRKELAELKGRLERLNDIMVRITTLEAKVKNIETYLPTIKKLIKRVERLERMSSRIRLSPVVGFMAWNTGDKTSYTGGMLGLRLETTLSGNLAFGFDGSALLAVDNRWFGTQARGYLRIPSVFTERFGLEIGFSGNWLGYNDQAEAKALIIAGDLGGTIYLYKGLWTSVNLYGGVELDRNDPEYAVGGTLKLGYEF